MLIAPHKNIKNQTNHIIRQYSDITFKFQQC